MLHYPYSHTETFWGEADTTTLPSRFIAMVQMSSEQLQQEMASSKNTLHVLEPHAPDYTGHNPSTVVAMVLYSQLYHHPVSLRNMPCALAMFLSYPIGPLTVSLWTLFVTSTHSLTCPFRL